MPNETRYIKTDESGWLRVLNDKSKDEYLCAYTKVVIQSESKGRTYFKVMDGPLKNKVCSLKSENAKTYLVPASTGKPTPTAATLTVKNSARQKVRSAALQKIIDQQTATMTFSGKSVDVTLNSVWTYSPLAAGKYKIKIPSWPERQSTPQAYKDHEPKLNYDQVRFRLSTDGTTTSYVHVSHESEGGVAVMSLAKWNELYTHLISHRLDNDHVGTLEIVFASKTLYVKTGDDGWLRTLDKDNKDVFLCAYTKVVTQAESKGRIYFKVMDGPHSNKVLSLKSENAGMHLREEGPMRSGAKLVVRYGKRKTQYSEPREQTLDQQLATMTFGAQTADVTLNSVWNSSYSPLPPGTYKILIPDRPHKATYTDFYKDYEPTLKYDQVWFPIEYKDNSRYVHVGHLSEGCVTTMSLGKWTALYEYLMSHRLSEKYVGTLEVIKP